MKILLLTLLLLLFMNCEDTENIKLKKQIQELKIKNKFLNDSINNILSNELKENIVVGIPDFYTLELNKKTRISYIFYKPEKKLPIQDVYFINGDNEIFLGTNNKTNFNFDFTPKNLGDNIVKLKFVESKTVNPAIIESEIHLIVKK